jgi:hypothetical protein
MSLRNWATPLTIATSLIVVISGILMFYHAGTPLGKFLHEWVGMGMAVVILAHIFVNVKAFKRYFHKPIPATIIGIGAIALIVGLLPLESEKQHPVRAVLDGLSRAPLVQITPIFGKTTQQFTAELAERGIAATPEMTLHSIAKASGKPPFMLYDILTGNKAADK